MLQGNRFFEYRPPENFKHRRSLILHKDFQQKYLNIFLSALFLGIFTFIAPAAYFIHQNYKIFTNLSFNLSPQLVDHLAREESWIYFLFTISTITFMSYFSYIVLRMTSKLVGPLMAVDRHMKKVIHGDFSIPSLKMRQDDDLKDILKTYDHLYQSLRYQIQQDVAQLQKLKVDSSDRESYGILQNIILRKEKQIGLIQDPIHFITTEKSSHLKKVS